MTGHLPLPIVRAFGRRPGLGPSFALPFGIAAPFCVYCLPFRECSAKLDLIADLALNLGRLSLVSSLQ